MFFFSLLFDSLFQKVAIHVNPHKCSYIKALFKTFGLDAHNDTLSVALVLQSSAEDASADSGGRGDGVVESVLYNAHWREHLLSDCAVTGESHVLGVNIELSPPESGARTALRAAAVKGGAVGQPG